MSQPEPTIDRIENGPAAWEVVFTDGSRLPVPNCGAADVDVLPGPQLAYRIRWYYAAGGGHELALTNECPRSVAARRLARAAGGIRNDEKARKL